MYSPHDDTDRAELEALFHTYRDACPAPEPSANFMPQLWQRIEAHQRSSSFFGRMASVLVTAAVALSLAMAAYLSLPRSPNAAFYSETYVEALAASHSVDVADVDSGALGEL